MPKLAWFVNVLSAPEPCMPDLARSQSMDNQGTSDIQRRVADQASLNIAVRRMLSDRIAWAAAAS
jgi:hypothetical protein